MNERSKRVHQEWNDFIAAGPEGAPPDDPFWLLVAEQRKVMDELMTRIARETAAELEAESE